MLFLGLWTKLMVVGGRSFGDESQLYDLSGKNLRCPSITDFLIDYDSVGTFIKNKALVCGGYNSYPYPGTVFSDCYSYDMQVDKH